jgi:hypothetical protein
LSNHEHVVMLPLSNLSQQQRTESQIQFEKTPGRFWIFTIISQVKLIHTIWHRPNQGKQADILDSWTTWI